MPAFAAVTSLTGELGPWVLGILSGAVGMIALALARWNIGALRREQFIKTITEYKAVYEEQERAIGRLKEDVKLATARNAEIAERLKAESEQCSYLLRRHYRWTRYVGRLHSQMRAAGIEVPTPPSEDEEA